MGFHFVPCYSVDSLKKIFVADKLAWSGTQASGTLTINEPNLFGGEKREGGVSGSVDVLDGNASQAVNSYLDSKIAGSVPAYRGVFSVIPKQVYIGINPYPKKWAFEVVRTATLTSGATQWNSADADISGDLNPAHILRECLTDTTWGMGYPAGVVDDTSFGAAADTLKAEAFGLSLIWNQSSTLEDFIKEILNHINAKLFVSPSTGKWTLKLLRDDYVLANLLDLNPSNVATVESYSRIAIGETVNEISVVYRDKVDNKDKTVTVQNIGNVQMQGAVVAQKTQYPGISNETLALKVAQRDLLAKSTPLSKLKIIVNREAYSLSIGDVFKFTWPQLGLVDIAYRVLKIDSGTVSDNSISITALEDIFGLPTSSYAEQQPSGWTDPTSDPVDVANVKLVEAPYWDIEIDGQVDTAAADPDFGYIQTLASAPSGDSFGYGVHTKVGGASYVETGEGEFGPTATLSGPLSISSTTVSFDNAQDTFIVNLSDHAYIGNEMVHVKTLDEVNGTMVVDRGILDTVPVDHPTGTRIWFSGGFTGADETERVDAEVVDVKLTQQTSRGEFDVASATSYQITLDNRYQRPYPPGNFRINSIAYNPNPITTPNVDITWSHRDKTQQLAGFTLQSSGDIGPEAGTTYTLTIKASDTSTLYTDNTLTGTSYSYTPIVNDVITIELFSTVSGLDSMQKQVWSISYEGFYTPTEVFDDSPSAGYTPTKNFTI